MVKVLVGVSLAVFAVSVPDQAAAQAFVEVNGARSDSEWGGELGLGYDLKVGAFTLRPGGGVFIYPGENDRYYTDEFDNGNSQCRDTTNGQFVDSELCNNTELRAYARLEATYNIEGGAEFGFGGRYSGDKVVPYGTVSFPLAPRFRVKGNAGDDYYAVGLLASF